MIALKTIQIFEHQKLFVDERLFSQAHWEALVLFNEIHGGKYCSLGYNYIKWGSYVGVVQIRDLIIEILPKVDALKDQKPVLWQDLLVDMLLVCNKIKLHKTGKTQQQVYTSNNSLLHIYFDLFAQELELLLTRGLVRNYEQTIVNSNSWKGQWQIAKHLQKNIVHQERCWSTQDKYSLAQPIHKVLSQAILLAVRQAPNAQLQQRFQKISNYFPTDIAVGNRSIDWNKIAKLQTTKKFKNYKEALDIAQLLLLNYTPNLQAGNYATLGILFDMNRLFEEYIYRTLAQNKLEVKVFWQPSKRFWDTKILRPDILLEKGDQKWVLDVKWKTPKQGKPSDQDLRQIYTYAKAFNAENGLLIYPKTGEHTNISDCFLLALDDKKTQGSILFLDIFDKSKNMLNQNLAGEIFTFLNIL